MSKRLIFTSVLVVLFALLCAKLMFDNGALSSTGKPNPASNAGEKSSTNITTANREPTTRPEPAPSNAPPLKMKSELVAGGRQWELSFADRSLPEEVRQRIGYDSNLVLGHLPKFEIDVLPFPIEVGGKQLDRRVRFEGEGRKWNDILQSDAFGCLSSGSSVEELYVPEPVIVAYTKAIELERLNQAAYQQLDRFLARMNELREKPVDNVLDFFVLTDDFKSAAADLAAVTPAGFAEGWGGKLYREPSILDVTETAGTPLEKYGSLVATTYAFASGKLEDLPLIVFSNGKWRFLLQRPPT